ncbi:DNA cytosine methyltransferase [Zunongwangia profunda]|uniref:DNA cytosine methyltransferase n=1 Tax=Zunongwangia profunda TaxID=398743 RepID=UPI00248E2B00|nr:DNA cytosine methyltransferase [Zunongwangia profunda]|tara:strand:- start:16139 stop:17005 length:867 start_codon:yes stop_codon:yes gene_type:complete
MIVESYFSGGGLFDIGLTESGIEISESYEIDKDCCKVQRKNFTHKVTRLDITEKLVLAKRKSDVMIFTYPCTKYSTIADIHKTRTGDEYFLHAFRHMAIGLPEVFVIENVPGMRAFPIVMEAMTKLPGYYVTTFCPVKTENWLPQKRDRLIIIGSKKLFNWREPEKKQRIKLKDIIEKDPIVTLPKAIANRMKGMYRDLPIISNPDKDDIAPTAVAHYAKDKSTRLVYDKKFPLKVRPYSVREYARLQGVPDSFEFNCSQTSAYRMIGNGVSVPVGRWVGKELKRYFE